MLFDYEIAICDRFKISPFELRRERFSEFCLLARRMQKLTKKEEVKKDKHGNVKKYIPVLDNKEVS